MTTSTVRKIWREPAYWRNSPFPIHPHMLRHACGYKLANDGHELGRYSTTSATRTFSTQSATRSRAGAIQELLAGLRGVDCACSSVRDHGHAAQGQGALSDVTDAPVAGCSQSAPNVCATD